MNKPFDFEVLKSKLQAQGLPVLEDTAEKLATVVFDWAEESIELHPNALVKALAKPAIQAIKPLAFGQLDKIDGQVG